MVAADLGQPKVALPVYVTIISLRRVSFQCRGFERATTSAQTLQ
jgi:hypothetical protein